MATDIDDQISYEHRSFWNDAIRRFARNRLALTGLVIVGFVSFLAIFADLLAPFPYDHAYFDKVLLSPPPSRAALRAWQAAQQTRRTLHTLSSHLGVF